MKFIYFVIKKYNQINEGKNRNKKLEDKINYLNNTITQLKQENKNIMKKIRRSEKSN